MGTAYDLSREGWDYLNSLKGNVRELNRRRLQTLEKHILKLCHSPGPYLYRYKPKEDLTEIYARASVSEFITSREESIIDLPEFVENPKVADYIHYFFTNLSISLKKLLNKRERRMKHESVKNVFPTKEVR